MVQKTQCMRPLAILQYTENVARNFRHSLRILTPWRSSWSTNRGRWQWWASSGWPPPSKKRKTNKIIWACLSSPPTLHTWELVSPCALHAFFAQPPSHQHTRVSNGHEVRTSPPATPLDICLPALSPWSPPPSLPSPFSSPGNISFERDLNIYMNVWNFIPKYSTRINSQYPSLITSNFSLSIALLSVHSSGPRTIVTTSLRRIL